MYKVMSWILQLTSLELVVLGIRLMVHRGLIYQERRVIMRTEQSHNILIIYFNISFVEEK